MPCAPSELAGGAVDSALNKVREELIGTMHRVVSNINVNSRRLQDNVEQFETVPELEPVNFRVERDKKWQCVKSKN